MRGEDRKRVSPTMVVSLVALLVAMAGTAYAALGPNSVGTRQLKTGAVVGSKFADNAVIGAKVAKHSVTGSDIKVADLGTVPTAGEAHKAAVTSTLNGHSASCPAGTILIHGLCFDASSSGPVTGKTASDACTARGGYLPTTDKLLAARGVLNLGRRERGS